MKNKEIKFNIYNKIIMRETPVAILYTTGVIVQVTHMLIKGDIKRKGL